MMFRSCNRKPNLAPSWLLIAGTIAAGAVLGGCAQSQEESGEGEEAAQTVALRLTAPAAGETLAGPDVEVRFELAGYEVYFDSTKGMGQHVHMILDNEPYIPHYSTAPFTFKNVAPGTHTIRAFPSREWHESIKEPGAFAMVTFHVGAADGNNTPDAGAPLLTYSRPKGEYAGAMAERILVDYWVSNCTIGPEAYRVRMRVDGSAQEFIAWEPYYLESLEAGEHQISLELVDPDGNPAPGPFNSTQRTITVAP